MITVIAGTNRPESNSLRVARNYAGLLNDLGENSQVLDLAAVPQMIFSAGNLLEKPTSLVEVEKQFLVKASRFVFVCPEYNGSIPGILKTLIDVVDIKSCFYDKKACLVGIAAGRAGNLRGMDHLTNILNHIRVEVMVNKLPISAVDDQMDETGRFHDQTRQLALTQLESFINF